MSSNIIIPGRDESAVAILRSAHRIAAKAAVTPSEIKKHLYIISGVLVIGALGAISTGIAIWAGAFDPSLQRLAAFLLLGSLSVVAFSVLGLITVAWSNLLYERVRRLALESEFLAPCALAKGSIDVWRNPALTEKIATAVMLQVSHSLKMSNEDMRRIVATLARETQLRRELSDLYCQELASATGQMELVRELTKESELNAIPT